MGQNSMQIIGLSGSVLGAIQQMENKDLTLNTPEFDIGKVSNLAAALAKALASIATYDKVITLDEFTVIAQASKHIATHSDNPLLVNTLVLHYLLNPIDTGRVFKELSKEAEGVELNTREAFFSVLSEVIALQHNDKDKLSKDLAHALNISVKNLHSQAKDLLTGISKFVPTKLVFKENRKERLLQFASLYHCKELYEAISKTEKGEEFSGELESQIESEKQRVKDAIFNFQSNNKEHPEYENAVKQLKELTEIMIDQVTSRLNVIKKRIQHDKEQFSRDSKKFVDDAVLEVQSAMKDRTLSSDYKRKDVWEIFGKKEAAQIIELRYNSLQRNHEEVMQLWSYEYEAFCKELAETQKAVMKSFNRSEFENLVPTGSDLFHSMNQLDGLTEGVLGVTIISAVASIGTGIIPNLVITGFFSSGIGLGIAGIIGASLLYKIFTNPAVRISKEISTIGNKLGEQLQKNVEASIEQHNKIMDEMYKSFFEVADIYYQPIAVNALLVTKYQEYHQKLVKQIVDETIEYVDNL